MAFTYNSIFAGSTIITKKDLCEFLNLDTSRPGLNFSDGEINKAYHRRAKLIHPDKGEIAGRPVPQELCQNIMKDINRAREHLIKHEENIPGAAFVDQGNTFKPENWVAAVIGTLNAVKTGGVYFSFGVTWLSRLSGNYVMIPLMSTFLGGELNFRFVNLLSPFLSTIRPYIKDIDGSTLIGVLRQLKDKIKDSEQWNIDELFVELKKVLPETMTNHPDFDKLLPAFKGTGTDLKAMLTDGFIDHLAHIVKFWPHFVANLPTWKQIIGVYFTSLVIFSSNLPQFFNAVKVIGDIIWQQKGGLALGLSALPLFLTTVLLLPISIMVQVFKQINWIALKNILPVLKSVYSLLISAIQLIRMLCSSNFVLLPHAAFAVFESIFDLTVRLSINLLLGALNSVAYILSDKSPLSLWLADINLAFDDLMEKMRPVPQTPEEQALAVVNQPNEPAANNGEARPGVGFFASTNLPFLNKEDVWLNQILVGLSADEQHAYAEAGGAPANAM